jgi:4-hydroxythreonine-4-phosphate dehydrogenase
MKLLGRRQAVTVTFGLPFIHSSVAHGTAFDIAWQRRAETAGMVEAIHAARLLAAGKRPV